MHRAKKANQTTRQPDNQTTRKRRGSTCRGRRVRVRVRRETTIFQVPCQSAKRRTFCGLNKKDSPPVASSFIMSSTAADNVDPCPSDDCGLGFTPRGDVSVLAPSLIGAVSSDIMKSRHHACHPTRTGRRHFECVGSLSSRHGTRSRKASVSASFNNRVFNNKSHNWLSDHLVLVPAPTPTQQSGVWHHERACRVLQTTRTHVPRANQNGTDVII